MKKGTKLWWDSFWYKEFGISYRAERKTRRMLWVMGRKYSWSTKRRHPSKPYFKYIRRLP